MKTTPTDLVPKLNATLSATWSAALFAMLSTALLALPVQPVAAAPPAAVAANAKVARLYEDALVRYEKQDLAGAIVQLKNALQIDKNQLPVQLLLGKALLAHSDAIGAEVAFTEAIRLGVNRAEVVLPLAQAVMAQGRLQDVLSQPRLALAGLPAATQVPLQLLRASAHADLGDPRAALKAIEDARAADPAAADSWLAEVPVRIRAREFREAQAAADRALALAPASAQAHYLRGTVAHIQGDGAAALAHYARALALQPTHTEALISRAGLLLDQGRSADAGRDVAELLRSSATDPRGFYLQSLIAEQQGNPALTRSALNKITALLDTVPLEALRYRPQALMLGGLAHHGLNQSGKAKTYLEAAQRLQPGSGVSKLLAQIYLAEKNVDGAIKMLEAYLRMQPGDSQAVMLLASAHMAQGRHGRATQLMQEALRTQDRPDLQTLLGMSLAGGARYADAAAAFEAAYRKDPSQLQAGVALAALYLQSGQAAKAQTVAEALVTQRGNSSGLQNLLGSARMQLGNTAGARSAFEAAVKLEPDFIAPQLNLARLDVQAKAFDAGAARLNAVLARDEKHVETLLELGRLAERRGQLVEAQRWLEKADDHSGPADPQAGLALVDFHLRINQAAAAQDASKRIVAKGADALPVLQALARVSLAQGDAAAARTSLTKAANLAGPNASSLLQTALLQVQAGHLAGAAHSLEKALANRPDYLPAQALLAEVEIRQGEFAKAEPRIKLIVAKAPRLGVGHALQGDLAAARGQRPAALEAYRRAHQAEPSSTSLLRLHALLATSDAAAAAQLAEQWLKQNPNSAPVRRALADGYARAGNLPAARAAYQSLVTLAPDDAEALNNLANVLLLANDPGALKVAEQALAKGPGTPHILGTAGWAAFKAGQSDRALQLLRDARLRDPGNPDTRYFLGAVLANTGRHTEAREELEAALKIGTTFQSARAAEQLLRTLK